MVRGLLLFFFLLTASFARAQTATATLDSTRILVGSAATLRLEVTLPKGTAVQWPTLPDSLGGLEVLSRGKVDTVVRGGEVAYRQAVQITGFDSGLFAVPPISFPTGNALLQTTPVPLLVQTLPVDTTQPFRPIKDIIEVPGSWLDYWPYLLAGVVLIAALLFVLLRKKRPKAAKTKALESPAVVAMRALEELEKSGLLERGAMSEAFTRASDILRRYLEGRFGVAALEEPTDAMLHSIRQRDDLRLQHGVLREFFLTADLAKFAKAIPTLGEARDAIGQARAFIQQTAGDSSSRRDVTGRGDQAQAASHPATPADAFLPAADTAGNTAAKPRVDDSEAFAAHIAEAADHFVEQFKGKLRLDYSVESLEELDAMLEDISEEYNADMDAETKAHFAESAAAYIFEVARRTYGGEYFWYDPLDQPILVTGRPHFETSLLAREKVKSRLANGSDDNIPYFFKGYADRVARKESAMIV